MGGNKIKCGRVMINQVVNNLSLVGYPRGLMVRFLLKGLSKV